MFHFEYELPGLRAPAEALIRALANAHRGEGELSIADLLGILPMLELPADFRHKLAGRGPIEFSKDVLLLHSQGEALQADFSVSGKPTRVHIPHEIGAEYSLAERSAVLEFQRGAENALQRAFQRIQIKQQGLPEAELKEVRVTSEGILARWSMGVRVIVRFGPPAAAAHQASEFLAPRPEPSAAPPAGPGLTTDFFVSAVAAARDPSFARVRMEYLAGTGRVLNGPVCVQLDKVRVNRMSSNEPVWEKNFECLGELAVSGADRTHQTALGWNTSAKRPYERSYAEGRLLYAGDPKGLLGITAQLLESDENQRKLVDSFLKILDMASERSLKWPVYGAAAAAGTGLLTSMLNLIKESIDDDHEMTLYASLNNLGQEVLAEGTYRIYKGRSKDDYDMAFDISIQPMQPAGDRTVTAKTDVIVLAESLDTDFMLDIKDLEEGQTSIKIHSAMGAGKNVRSLLFEQKYKNKAQRLPYRLALQDAILYRGPYGNGIPWEFSLQSASPDLSKHYKAIVNGIGHLVQALWPDEEDRIEQAARTALQLNQAFAQIHKDTRIKGSVNGLILHGTHRPGARGLYPADLSADRWTDYAVSFPVAAHVNATLNLKIRRA